MSKTKKTETADSNFNDLAAQGFVPSFLTAEVSA